MNNPCCCSGFAWFDPFQGRISIIASIFKQIGQNKVSSCVSIQPHLRWNNRKRSTGKLLSVIHFLISPFFYIPLSFVVFTITPILNASIKGKALFVRALLFVVSQPFLSIYLYWKWCNDRIRRTIMSLSFCCFSYCCRCTIRCDLYYYCSSQILRTFEFLHTCQVGYLYFNVLYTCTRFSNSTICTSRYSN